MTDTLRPTGETATPRELAKAFSITLAELSDFGDRVSVCDGEWRLGTNDDRPEWRFFENPEAVA